MTDNEPDTPQDPFPVDCLPGPLASFVATVAASLACDPSFVALPVLTVCGAAVGNTARLRLKPGYDVPPIVWSVIIGESGSGKTPAFDAAMRPLVAMQNRSLREHAAAMDLHRSRMRVYKRELSKWEKVDSIGQPPAEPKEPTAKRYYVSDTTIQALAKLLSENPRGLLLALEELPQWFGSFDKFTKGAGSDAAAWLQLYGAGTLTVDRKNDGVLSIPRAAVCVTGGIQPGILNESLTPSHRESGMSPRLLKTYPPRHRRQWSDTGVNPETEAGYAELVEGIHALGFDGVDSDGLPKPNVVELSSEARAVYVKFVDKNGEEQSTLTGELASTLDKIEQYAARFALIFHYVRAVSCDATLTDQRFVDGETMRQAVRLAEWLKRESLWVHEILSPSRKSKSPEQEVIDFIRSRGDRATVREIQKAKPHLGTADEIRELLNTQANSGRGSWENVGRTVEFVLSA